MGISSAAAAAALGRGISSPTPVKSLRRAAAAAYRMKRGVPDREALGRFGRIALRIADHALAEASSTPHHSVGIPVPVYRLLREELGSCCLHAVSGGGKNADEELLALGEKLEMEEGVDGFVFKGLC